MNADTTPAPGPPLFADALAHASQKAGRDAAPTGDFYSAMYSVDTTIAQLLDCPNPEGVQGYADHAAALLGDLHVLLAAKARHLLDAVAHKGAKKPAALARVAQQLASLAKDELPAHEAPAEPAKAAKPAK